MHGAQFQEANLIEADFLNAYVHETNFRGAALDWVDLRGIFCGEDSDAPRSCTEEDLLAVGLPSYAQRPPNACWPGYEPIGEHAKCGEAARDSRQAQLGGGDCRTNR